MPYESPINISYTEALQVSEADSLVNKIAEKAAKSMDDAVMLAVRQHIGVDVDKEELTKALKYDREQYQKGYKDGKRDGMSEIRMFVDENGIEHPMRKYGDIIPIKWIGTPGKKFSIPQCGACRYTMIGMGPSTMFCPRCGTQYRSAEEVEPWT